MIISLIIFFTALIFRKLCKIQTIFDSRKREKKTKRTKAVRTESDTDSKIQIQICFG